MTVRGDSATLLVRADAARQRGRPGEAVRLLERAIETDSENSALRERCAALLLDIGRPGEALPHTRRLHAADATNVTWRRMLAIALARTGAHSLAADLYPFLLELDSRDATLWVAYAWALRYAGRTAKAEEAFRQAIAGAPDLGEAYLAVQDMTGRGLDDADIAAIEIQLARPGLTVIARSHLHYALGRALERRGMIEASWSHYVRGAKFRRMTIGYDETRRAAQAARLAEIFTADFFREREGWGDPDPSPIFICGMPRSGTTLLEQALAAHSMVEGTQELPELPNIISDLVDALGAGDSENYPACLVRATRQQVSKAGTRYVERTRPYRHLKRPYFTDKLLPNWLHIGVIHLILPRATIIDARRDPRAACLSAFKQDFGSGQRFSYDLAELGRHHREYARLVEHYEQALPERVLHVSYENVVRDLEGEIRRVLGRIGIPFQPSCLTFWQTERIVSTASSDQVRRPLYQDSLDGWRRYERWLDPLLKELNCASSV